MAYEDRKKKREAKFRDIIQDTEGNIVYTGDLWRIADSEEAGSGRRQARHDRRRHECRASCGRTAVCGVCRRDIHNRTSALNNKRPAGVILN